MLSFFSSEERCASLEAQFAGELPARCDPKLMTNYNFDPHTEASRQRDNTGTFLTGFQIRQKVELIHLSFSSIACCSQVARWKKSDFYASAKLCHL